MSDFESVARGLGLDPSVIEEALGNAKIAEAISEQARRKIEEPYRIYQPLPQQRAFHAHAARVRVVAGGNRSGKTRGGAQEAIWYAMGDHPFRAAPTPSHGWVVSEDWNVIRDVQLPYFFSLLPAGTYSWNKSDRIITITQGQGKGSTIGFKSVDSGWQKFQGTARHWIWFDEEPEDEKVYNECMARLVDHRGAHWITWTPLRGLTWLYHRLWVAGASRPEVARFRFRSEDNRHVDPAELRGQFAGMSEDEQRVRLYGDFITLGGRPVFNQQDLLWHAQHVRAGRTGDLRWTNDERTEASFRPRALNRRKDAGYLEVWEEPEPLHEYVIGSDHSEGRLLGDATDAYVKDRHTGRQVAEWHGRRDAGEFAEALLQLGYFYNTALLAPERNAVGLVVIDRLKAAAYPRIYVERAREGATSERQTSYGFLTTEKSKRTGVELLRILIARRLPGTIRSARRLAELQAYEFDARGRMGAAAGCNDEHDPACHEGHDDTVASLWCATVADNDTSPPEPLPVNPELRATGGAAWALQALARWREREKEREEMAVAEAEDERWYDEAEEWRP